MDIKTGKAMVSPRGLYLFPEKTKIPQFRRYGPISFDYRKIKNSADLIGKRRTSNDVLQLSTSQHKLLDLASIMFIGTKKKWERQ